MPAPRNRRHIFVPTPPNTDPFKGHRRPPQPKVPRAQDRVGHAEALRGALDVAQREGETRRTAHAIRVTGAAPGIYIEFDSIPRFELKLDSLDVNRSGIAPSAVRIATAEDGSSIQRATVFVPEGRLAHFLGRLEQYATEESKKGEPRNRDLVDRIADVRLATSRALWFDPPQAYPAEGAEIWWEVWLRRTDGHELDRFLEFARQTGVRVGSRRIAFHNRIVCLALATVQQLSVAIDVPGDVAELRRAKIEAGFFAALPPHEPPPWADARRSGRETRPAVERSSGRRNSRWMPNWRSAKSSACRTALIDTPCSVRSARSTCASIRL